MTTLVLRDVMRANPVTIEGTQSVLDATNTMSRLDVRHLIVVASSGQPVGVVSQRDLFRHLAAVSLAGRQTPIRSIASEPLISGTPDLPVEDASNRLLEYRIGCLAILDEEALVGIVTRSDLLAHASWQMKPDGIGLSPGDRVTIRNGETGTVVRLDGAMAQVLLDSSIRKSVAIAVLQRIGSADRQNHAIASR